MPPPRTRTNKLSKASKENAVVSLKKAAEKNNIHAVKDKRKPLADKTNSASDENDSKLTNKDIMRPRRDRRLPSRFIDNNLLVNLSTSFSHSTPVKTVRMREVSIKDEVAKQVKPKKDVCKANSDKNNNPGKEKRGVPKTATNNAIISVAKTRGKRVISPVAQPGAKDEITLALKTRGNNVTSHVVKTRGKDITSPLAQCRSKDEITPVLKTSGNNVISPMVKTRCKDEITPVPKTSGKNVISPVAKTRGKGEITPVLKTRGKNVVIPVVKSRGKDKTSPLSKLLNANKITPVKKTVIKTPNYKKDFSYRVLEDKVSPKIIKEKLAVYDFTFDPSEEPPPQKKKKKVIRKKGPPKPKSYAYNNYYEHNVSNALEALKTVVKQKLVNNAKQNPIPIDEIPVKTNPVQVMSNESLRQTEEVHFSEINYSPCHSPNNITTKETLVNNVENLRTKSMGNTKLVNKNIINIQDEISFFDDVPIANSSMNESVRNPNASPWRVEFKNLPIKWGANSYIKANMTPAVDSSYINAEESGKKQVYTNILFNDLDKVNTSDNPKLKQTSITTFMKDNNEKVLQNENKIFTPTKDNSVFDDSKSDCSNPEPVPDNIFVPKLDISLELNENNKSNINSTPLKRKNDEVLYEVPSKTRKEVVATAENFFGFDESTINDQENISPDKISEKIVRKPKLSRKVLQEKNQLAGPMRANLPRFVKNKILDVQVPLVIPSVNDVITENDLVQPVAENSDLDEENSGSDKEESTPIGLFEDIEIVHHNKPTRKSYGKAKKVTFRQQTAAEPDDLEVNTTGESDLVDDTSFHVPLVRVRKPGKKIKVQKRSKQEEKEVEAWAAGFNSMCEDVDNFDLVVE